MADEKEARPSRLTHQFIKRAEPGRYGDGRGGNGLNVFIKQRPSGRVTRTWCQRIRIKGQVTNVGLGSFPAVSLAMARAKAADHVRRVAEGEDIRKQTFKAPTLDAVIDQMIATRTRPDTPKKTINEWNRLKAYCAPIGSKVVSDVSTADVLGVIETLWDRRNRTARDVHDFLAAAMRRAIRYGYRTDNPAPKDITEDLGKPTPKVHHESLDHAKVGQALAVIRDSDAWWAVRYCLLFLALTGVRSENARTATWEEMNIEGDSPIWTIPAEKMKNRLEHVVPLSTQSVEILLYVEAMNGSRRGTIFPPKRGGQHIYASSLSELMKRLKIPAVPHGFRSSFRNWAGGRADISEPVAERVLAHKPKDQTVEAYLNAPFIEERTPVMQMWADYLTETMGPVAPQ